MIEKEKNQEEIILPPVWCGALCRNSMNEVCLEHCAIERDCSGFDPKPNLKLIDMPQFPKTDGMTREEKFTSVTIYLAKVVDHLKGTDNGQYTYPIPRSHPYRTRSVRLPENLKVEDLLLGVQTGNPPPENRTQRQDSPERSSKVDGKTGQTT